MKRLIAAFAILFGAGFVFSIDVNRKELESVSGSIEFENYGGPHYVIESARAIKEIGGSLGRSVAANVGVDNIFGERAKYSVIHSVTADEEGRLDADIFILNETAGVDHITNLRRILTGYLEAAYGYSTEDAQTVALFVTVYNAVYRGQISAFQDKYKTSVLAHLDEKKVGLSTNWEEWPGRTQIVIPLGILSESASAVETSVISDDKVVEALRQDEGMGIKEREGMADLKEREVAQADAKAKEAQKDATAAKPDAQAAKSDARKNPMNAEKKEAAAQAQKKVQDAEKKSSVNQQIADRKREEAAAEREAIAKDKKALVEKAVAKETAEHIDGLSKAGSGLYSIVKVDAENGKVVKTSGVKSIRQQNLYLVKDIRIQEDDGSSVTYPMMYLVICGVKDGHSAVRLALIDAMTLELKKESEAVLSEKSPLIFNQGSYYAVMADGGKFRLAQFDQNLNLRNKSSEAVQEDSPVTLTSRGFLATGDSGSPVLLRISDLTSVWSGNLAEIDAK